MGGEDGSISLLSHSTSIHFSGTGLFSETLAQNHFCLYYFFPTNLCAPFTKKEGKNMKAVISEWFC